MTQWKRDFLLFLFKKKRKKEDAQLVVAVQTARIEMNLIRKRVAPIAIHYLYSVI